MKFRDARAPMMARITGILLRMCVFRFLDPRHTMNWLWHYGHYGTQWHPVDRRDTG